MTKGVKNYSKKLGCKLANTFYPKYLAKYNIWFQYFVLNIVICTMQSNILINGKYMNKAYT